MLRTVLKRSVRLYSTTTNSTSLRVSAKEVAPAVAQSPNRATTWSENQRAKHVAMSGPRFEQMNLEAQVDYRFAFLDECHADPFTAVAQLHGCH